MADEKQAVKMGRKCKSYDRGDGVCVEEHCFNCGRHLDGDSHCPKGCDTATEAQRDDANNEEE